MKNFQLATTTQDVIIREEELDDERVDDSFQLPNYTEKENKATKRKLATEVNQPRITNYFTAKKPRVDVANEILQLQREPPNVATNVFYCKCGLPAYKNYVTSKAKHIKNFGRPYYYCKKKLLSMLGLNAVP